MRGHLALLSALLLVACSANGGAPPSSPESRAVQGQAWFRGYCSSCHGAGATGDGPVAGYLTTPPADLTRIAINNGGVFDKAKVASFIDGRARVAAHGSPEMPVWGRALDDRRGGGFADETLLSPGTILVIVEYLASIQVPVPKGR
jgi:mono/diheme cytochrome c family protein